MAKKSCPINPLNDRVVVRPLETEAQTTSGGIVLPETAQEKPQLAEVIAVGPGRVGDDNARVKPEVKIGDLVFHSKYGGTLIKYEGEEYIILKEEDILATVN